MKRTKAECVTCRQGHQLTNVKLRRTLRQLLECVDAHKAYYNDQTIEDLDGACALARSVLNE